MTLGRRSRAVAGACLAGLLAVAAAGGVLAAAPANDDRTGATPITLTSGGTVDQTDATTAVDDPAPCQSGTTEYRSIWFAYTATEAGPTLIGALTNDQNALHVLAPDGTTELGCVVGSPALVAPHVDFDAVVGETYLVELATTADLATLGGLAVERELVFSAEPLPTGHVTSGGDVRFDWTIACSVAGILEPEIDLDQGTGANRAMGSELVTVNCIPPKTVVHMTVKHGSGPNPNALFHAGDAKALFQVRMFTFMQTDDLDTRPVIRLTGGPSPTAAPPAPTLPPTSTEATVTVAAGNAGGLDGAWLMLLGGAIAGGVWMRRSIRPRC